MGESEKCVCDTMLKRARQDGLLRTIMYYSKLGLVVTSLYFYLSLSSSNNDSHYVPKAKRGKWCNAMINAVSKTAYYAGNNKMMQVAEWLIESKTAKTSSEYAKIQRLQSSMIKFKRSAVMLYPPDEWKAMSKTHKQQVNNLKRANSWIDNVTPPPGYQLSSDGYAIRSANISNLNSIGLPPVPASIAPPAVPAGDASVPSIIHTNSSNAGDAFGQQRRQGSSIQQMNSGASVDSRSLAMVQIAGRNYFGGVYDQNGNRLN